MKKLVTIIVVVIAFAVNSVEAAEPVTYGSKSPGVATALSAFGAAVPIFIGIASVGSESGGGAGIVLLGTIFGPGMGHAYAGNSGRFFSGAGIRTLGWGGLVVAVAVSWDDPASAVGIAAAIGGATIIVVSSVWDVVSAGSSARKFNERHGLTVSPTYDHKSKTPGLQLAMNF